MGTTVKGISMKHEHLPALNKYTSANQYAALQEVEKSGSLINLVTQGRMGTTIGALIRSAWMDSEVITDAQGVTSERWYVTDAGKHAMQIYQIKAIQEQQKAEARAETQRIIQEERLQRNNRMQETYAKLVTYYETRKKMVAELAELWDILVQSGRQIAMSKEEWHNMKCAAKLKAGVVEEDTRYDIKNGRAGAWVKRDPAW